LLSLSIVGGFDGRGDRDCWSGRALGDLSTHCPEGVMAKCALIGIPARRLRRVRNHGEAFLRSALFAAVQGKTRRYLKGEFLGAVQGVSVKFTGMQLDQSDLDVWEQATHLARLHPLGNVCHFKGYPASLRFAPLRRNPLRFRGLRPHLLFGEEGGLAGVSPQKLTTGQI
jgi:hypothetical protein